MSSNSDISTSKSRTVGIELIRPNAVMPFYAREGDSGMDVCAAEDVLLEVGETSLIPTGLKFVIPEGMEIQVRPRSGLSLKTPLRLPNSPGTIDAGYKDELHIIVHNSSPMEEAAGALYTLDEKNNRKGSYQIRKGDRIAQLVFATVTKIEFVTTEEAIASLDIVDNRGGGFGSTGTNVN